METFLNWELDILNRIQNCMQCAFLDWLFPAVTKLGDAGIIWILLTLVLMIFPKTRKTASMLAIALTVGFLLGNLTLKPLVARVRPFILNPSVVLLIDAPHDYSFPSGHTLSSFEAAFVLLFRSRKMGIPAVILASLIAFSRMYLYVHYPTDVLAGILLAFVIAIFSVWLTELLYRKIRSDQL